MTDSKAITSPKAAKKASSAARKPMEHPPYANMAAAAVKALKERNGSSRQAILKYIMANYKVGRDQKPVNSRLKVALRNSIAKGLLRHHGKASVGASGSFKIGEKAVEAAKAAKKPAAKKPKKAADAKAKKSTAVKKPKKAASPKKKAAASKAKMTPKKGAAKKPGAAKKAKAATPKKKAAAASKKPTTKKAKTPKKKAAAKPKK